MNTPKYDINQIVYLRESAAIGHIEPVKISGMQKRGKDWIYNVFAGTVGAVNAAYYGDRRSLINGSVLYFTEAEFVTEYEALKLTEANLEIQLSKVRSQISSRYPNGD